jgi:hypothetical protein
VVVTDRGTSSAARRALSRTGVEVLVA